MENRTRFLGRRHTFAKSVDRAISVDNIASLNIYGIMFILFQSLPLSFQTFWRYLILLPFLAIGAFVISLAGFLPIVGYFVPGVVSAGLTIIGLRCALAARGHGDALDAGRLLRISFLFCLIFLGAELFLSAAYWGISQAMNALGVELNPMGLFVGLFGVSFYWSSLLMALLSPIALVSSVLAVPMTAHVASPHHSNTPIFFGFGKGVVSLMIVSGVWLMAGRVFAFVGEIWTTFGLVFTALWALLRGKEFPWEISLDPLNVFLGTVLMAWASSWFFATAVIAWEKHVARQQDDAQAEREESRISSDDIRALRQKRM